MFDSVRKNTKKYFDIIAQEKKIDLKSVEEKLYYNFSSTNFFFFKNYLYN